MHHVLRVDRQRKEREPVLEDAQDADRDQRPDERPSPAREARAAEDRRRDDGEEIRVAHLGGRRGELRGDDDPGEAGAERDRDEEPDPEQVGPDARPHRRVVVVADRVDVPPERRPAQHRVADGPDAEEDVELNRELPDVAGADLLVAAAVDDHGRAVREHVRDPERDRVHAERDDERVDLEEDDEHAVQEADPGGGERGDRATRPMG